MGFYDVLENVSDRSGVSMRQIGPRMGKAPAYVGAARSRGSDPATANAAAMLEACGWRLVAGPAADVPPSALVIDAPAADGDAERRALERKRDRLRRELAATEEQLG